MQEADHIGNDLGDGLRSLHIEVCIGVCAELAPNNQLSQPVCSTVCATFLL